MPVLCQYYAAISVGSDLPTPDKIYESADAMLMELAHRDAPLALGHYTGVFAKRLDTQISNPTDKHPSVLVDIIHTDSLNGRKLKLAIFNMRLNEGNISAALQGKPNRTLKRYEEINAVLTASARQKADIVLMPELSIPLEWLNAISGFAMRENIGIVCGIEHVLSQCGDAHEDRVGYNLTAVILPYRRDDYPYVSITFHSKVHWSPLETKTFHTHAHKPVQGHTFEIFHWRDVWFPVYCCFELASAIERTLFAGMADIVLVAEWNRDTTYFANIIKALSRDLCCYCAQANNSTYGDSRIVQPSKSELVDIVRIKGGKNATVLIGEVDIDVIRRKQLGENVDRLKPLPPGFDTETARKKHTGILAGSLLSNRRR